jgi:hypothetical protein
VSGKDTSLWQFKKWDFAKKNNLTIRSMELSCGPCFGDCPVTDLKITEDSTLYIYEYRHQKYRGLHRHKLTNMEFQKIQDKLNAINIDSFFFSGYKSDAPFYSLFIKSSGKPINIHGTRPDKNLPFNLFLYYLESMDLLLPFEKTNEDIQFRNKTNKQMEERRMNGY